MLGERVHDHRPGTAPHLSAYGVVHSQDIDSVPGARGQRGQQQCRLYLGVEPGSVSQAGCRQTTRVDDDEHAPVALGTPGAHQDLAAAGGGAPVDGAYVVADDVLAKGVELGPLTAHHHCAATVHLPQPGQA